MKNENSKMKPTMLKSIASSLIALGFAFNLAGCDVSDIPTCPDIGDDLLPGESCRCGLGYENVNHICCSALSDSTTVDCGPGERTEYNGIEYWRAVEQSALLDGEPPLSGPAYLYYQPGHSTNDLPILGVFDLRTEIQDGSDWQTGRPNTDEDFRFAWTYGNPMSVVIFSSEDYSLYETSGSSFPVIEFNDDANPFLNTRDAGWPRLGRGETVVIETQPIALAQGQYSAEIINLPPVKGGHLGSRRLNCVGVGEYCD